MERANTVAHMSYFHKGVQKRNLRIIDPLRKYPSHVYCVSRSVHGYKDVRTKRPLVLMSPDSLVEMTDVGIIKIFLINLFLKYSFFLILKILVFALDTIIYLKNNLKLMNN